MKTSLHAAAIFAALSATVLAGCGGGNPQEEAEKAVMAFVTAAGNGDFKTADELAYCADSNEAQTWAAVKVLSKKYETASDEALKNLPPMPILACDFEVLHADNTNTIFEIVHQPVVLIYKNNASVYAVQAGIGHIDHRFGLAAALVPYQ